MLGKIFDQLGLCKHTSTRWTSENEAEIYSLGGRYFADVSTARGWKFTLLLRFFRCGTFSSGLVLLVNECLHGCLFVLFDCFHADAPMLGLVAILIVFHQVLLTTAGENCEEVDVWVELGCCADRLLNFQELVPLILFVVVVAEEHLLTVVGHAVTGEELHNQSPLLRSVWLLDVASLDNEPQLLLPLLDSGFVAAYFVALRNQLALLFREAVLVHKVVLGFGGCLPAHLNMSIRLPPNLFLVQISIFARVDLFQDDLAVTRESEQVEVVWQASKLVKAVVDRLGSVVDNCGEVGHPLGGSFLHESLELFSLELDLSSFELFEGSLALWTAWYSLSDLDPLGSDCLFDGLEVVVADIVELREGKHEDMHVIVIEVLFLHHLEHRL